MSVKQQTEEVVIDYTNYKGVRELRRIIPKTMFFGLNIYHEGKQWFLEAWACDRQASRVFAMKRIHSWAPKQED